MPAVACGTMRIDRLITRTTSAMNTSSRMVPTRGLMAASLPRPERGPRCFAGVSGLVCYVTDRERVRLLGRNLACTRRPSCLAVLDLQLDTEAAGQVPRGEDVLDRPGREHRAAAQQHGMGEAVRHL